MKGHNIRHCFQALLKYRIMGSPQDQTVKLRICLKEIIVLTGFQFPDLLDCGDQCLFQIIDLVLKYCQAALKILSVLSLHSA